MKTIGLKPDAIGAIVSVLCLIHCIATPFIFVAKASSAICCEDAPIWWQAMDYLFIVISLVTIYLATRNSTKSWIRIAFWSAWIILLFVILNETFETVPLQEAFVYVPALSIAGLHLYNQKYCKCSGNECCVN